jgi:hypothetical protein
VTSGLGVWENQIAEHCPVSCSSRLYGEEYERIHARGYPIAIFDGKAHLRFLIVNFQNVYSREKDTRHPREWLTAPNQALLDWDADLVIVDESHHIGNPTAVQSRETCRLGRKARFRVFMTGSMFHRNLFYVFGQVKFYDDGAALGSSFTHYKKRIAVMGGYGGYEVLRYRNLRWMTRQLKPFVYMEKYVPPRPPVTNLLTFDLTGRNLEYYSAMHRKGAVTDGDKLSTAPLVLTKHLRLQQICGGFLRWEDTVAQIGSDKLDMCRDRLSEYMEQGIEKAVIGCRFLPELAAVARIARDLDFLPILFHGSVPKGDERTRRIALFQETKRPALFVSQISAGKESIDLSAASVMMFYSLSESYVDHDQFTRRIEKYKDTRTLMYDYLIANGTRDEVTYAALQMKKNVADFIVSNPERVEEIATLENRMRALRV